MIESLLAVAFLAVFAPLGYWASGRYLDHRYNHWLNHERHRI